MTESGGATGLGSDGEGASAQTPLAGERFAGDFTDLADAVSLDHSHDDDPGSSDREHRIEFLESESSEHRDSDLETGFDRHGDGDGWNDSHVGDLSYEKNGEVKSSSGGSGGGGHGSYDPAPSGVVHDPVKRNNLNPVTGTAAGPRAWLRINEEGVCTPVTIDKHRLAQHLGVPMRDFRMLEPNRSDSYSAAILCRERCIVMHIEQVRLLITSENIFMQDGRSYTVMKILPELQRRLLMRKLKLMDGRCVNTNPNPASLFTATSGVQGRTPFQSRIYTRPCKTDTFFVWYQDGTERPRRRPNSGSGRPRHGRDSGGKRKGERARAVQAENEQPRRRREWATFARR